jgi:multidrug efflux system outer membrane protein
MSSLKLPNHEFEPFSRASQRGPKLAFLYSHLSETIIRDRVNDRTARLNHSVDPSSSTLFRLSMKPHHIALPAALLLGSCTLGPDFKLPSAAGGNKWKENHSTAANHLPDDWWRLFHDRDLTQYVNRALSANNDLSAAKARVETARALVGVNQAHLFPTLGLTSAAGETRNSAQVVQQNLPPGYTVPLTTRNYQSALNLAYEPDLWGRNKRLIEAASAQEASAESLLDSQRLGLAAEVARQYFLLRGLDSQESIVLDTIKSRQQSFDLQKSQADAGLIDGLSTSRAKTELELAKNDLSSVQRQRGAAEHALAVLCGARPSDFSVAHRGISSSLPNIRAGLPAEVLIRRPDVRAAEQDLRAANANIGVAETAFYPNFSLSASGGFQSINVNDFLNWENRVLSIGAGMTAPLFDGGANKANYKAAHSRYDEALAKYRQSLLVALREVEDSLVDLKGLEQSKSILQRALTSAQDTYNLSKERFDKGLTSYLDVVDADRSVLQIRLSLSEVQAQQRISLTALAKALGGGWSGK